MQMETHTRNAECKTTMSWCSQGQGAVKPPFHQALHIAWRRYMVLKFGKCSKMYKSYSHYVWFREQSVQPPNPDVRRIHIVFTIPTYSCIFTNVHKLIRRSSMLNDTNAASIQQSKACSSYEMKYNRARLRK